MKELIAVTLKRPWWLAGLCAVLLCAGVAPASANKPQLVPGGTVSGLPVVAFDGRGGYLEVGSNPADFDGGFSPGKTTLVVFRQSSDGFGGPSNPRHLVTSSYNTLDPSGHPSPLYQVNTTTLTSGQFRLEHLTATGGVRDVTVTGAGQLSTEHFAIGSNLWLGDADFVGVVRTWENDRFGAFAENAGANASPQGHLFTRIGAASLRNNPNIFLEGLFFRGEIAAVIAYNRAISSSELLSVEEHLYQVYLSESGGDPNFLPVTDGLVLHLNGSNVVTENGAVSRMIDISGRNNHADAFVTNISAIVSSEKTETFDTAESAAENGWVELFSREGGGDFGFSPTRVAGGESGEAGGVAARDGVRRMYVDVFEAGTLTLNDWIRASGKVAMRGNPGNASLVVGHSDSTLAGRASSAANRANKLGFNITGPGQQGKGRFFSHIVLANGSQIETAFVNPVDMDVVYEWNYVWNPDERSLTVTIENTETGEVFERVESLNASQLQIGATFDSFGLTTRALSVQDATIEAFIDDVTYTAMVAGEIPPPELLRITGFAEVFQDREHYSVKLKFNRELEKASATNTANYSIDGLTVESASLSADGMIVTLITSPQTEGVTYTVQIDNVRDRTVLENVFSGEASFVPVRLTVKTETFDTAESAAENGWVELFSREGDGDFGFSPTSFAGGESGEAGGVAARDGVRRMYVDVFEGGTLTLNDWIRASGKVAMRGDPGGANLVVGHSDSTLAGGASSAANRANKIGFNIAGPGQEGKGRFFSHIKLANGSRIETAFVNPVDMDVIYEWDYVWNPDEGTLTVTIENTETGEVFERVESLNASQLEIGATFDSFGLTTRALSVLDATIEAFIDDVTYDTASEQTVTPGETFSDWAARFDLPEGQDGLLDNPVGDGIENALKFALGMDPREPSREDLPVESIEEVDGERYLTLAFDRPENLSGVSYHVDASSDLRDWPDSAIELPGATSNGDGSERVIFRDTQPVDASDRRFLRLRVEVER